MKPFVPGRLLAVVFFALSIGAASAATSGVQVIHVSLEGEAGQPMSIKLDAQQAKVVEFDVKNDAISTDHEVVLVKLRKKADVISADAKTHRVDEHKLKSMGEVAGLKPGQDGKLTVKLPAGDYVLLCNHKEHYELGMATPFTVVR